MNFQHEEDARIYSEHQRSGTTGEFAVMFLCGLGAVCFLGTILIVALA